MKTRKIISVILTFALIISLMTGFTAVYAENTGATLINMFPTPTFDTADNITIGNWIAVVGVEDVNSNGNLWATVKHPDYASMKLRGTSDNTSIGFKLNTDNTIVAGHKYYVTFKGKSLDAGSNNVATWMTLGGAGIGFTLKSGEEVFSAELTATSAANSVTLGANPKKATKFAVDNMYVYDITNAHEITADGAAQLDSSTFANIGTKKMANVGDTVRFTITEAENTAYTVTAGTTTLQKGVDGYYSFVMPSSDCAISVTSEHIGTTLENIFPTPTFDTADNIATGNWIAVVGVEDVNSNGNLWATVKHPDYASMKLRGTSDNTSIGFKLNTGNTIVAGHKYYVEFKGKSLDAGSNNVATWMTLGGQGIGFTLKVREEVFSAELTATSAANSVTLGANPKKATKFAVDNMYVYDITNAHNVIADSIVQFADNSVATVNGSKKTNTGDIVTFTLSREIGQNDKIKMDGTELTPTNGVYSFTMPSQDVSIEYEIVQEKLVNLVENGDMTLPNSDFWTSVDYGITADYVTEDENTVLSIDARGNTTSNVGSTMHYSMPFLKDNSYYIAFKGECSDETIEAINNSGVALYIYFTNSANPSASKWVDDKLRNNTMTFAMKEKENTLHIGAQGQRFAKYAIDDFEVYNVTGAKEISFKTTGGIIIPRSADGVLIDSRRSLIYAMEGTEIVFDFIGSDSFGKYIKTSCSQNQDGSYSYTVGADSTQIPFEYTDKVSYTIADGQLSVNSAEAESFDIIAAEYAGNNLVNTSVLHTTVDAQTRSAALESTLLSSSNKVKLFTWNTAAGMTPLRRAFCVKAPDTTIYLAGDQTLKALSDNAANQGWGAEFAKLVKANATVVNKSTGGATAAGYLTSAEYSDMATNWQPGDYVIIVLGINDAIKNTTLEAYTAALRTLINSAKNAGVNVLLVKEQPTNLAAINSAMSLYLEALGDLAAEENVPVTDLNAEVASMPQSFFDSADNISLSFAGAQYTAEKFVAAIFSTETGIRDYLSK